MADGRFVAVQEPHAAPSAWQLARLMDGFVVTQLLYVTAKLGVVDVLAEGPRSGPDVAAAVGAHPGHLTRVLRGLVTEDVLAEDTDGRFGLTPLGAAFREMQGAVVARGELYYEAAGGLLDAVREGGVAFEHCHGRSFFDHLRDHPDQEAAFHASMAVRARQEADDVIDAYDFGGLSHLVDVGGGNGVLLAGVLRANGTLQGTLLDRAAVIPAAEAHLAAAGVAERARCVAGDFFDDVPAGADAYVLSRVLHDWDDDAAGRILAVCRRRMAPQSRLLVVDAILPERAEDGPAAVRMDLHMLLLFGARERTEAELRDLLRGADLVLQRRIDTRSPAGLAVLEAVPA